MISRGPIPILLALLVWCAAADGLALTGEAWGDAVELAAIGAVRATVAAPDRVEVSAVRVDPFEPPSAVVPGVEVIETRRLNAAGRAHVRIALLADGRRAGEVRVTVTARVRGPALVALRTLKRSEPVPADAVERVDVDVTRLAGSPVRSAEELAGRVPARTLGTGRILDGDLLVPEPLARKGDTVELLIRRGGVLVTSPGVLRADAAPGERVVARNLTGGHEVVGEMQADGTLLILGVARPGSRRR